MNIIYEIRNSQPTYQDKCEIVVTNPVKLQIYSLPIIKFNYVSF
jgi:hypothetical protein